MTFPRQYPTGVPFRAQLTSAIATNWDIFISQAVDGVGGGNYAAALQFGQMSSAHLTMLLERQLNPALSPSFTLDLNASQSLLEIVSPTDANQTIAVNVNNAKSGDVVEVILDASNLSTNHIITMSWLGTGPNQNNSPALIHRFATGDDQPVLGPCRCKWMGRASSDGVSANTYASSIYWTLTRY